MSTRVFIEDDGDETIIVKVNEEVIGEFDHDQYGWAGMEAVISLIENLSDTFGFPVTNNQDVV